jgi:hypothetical protein
VTSARISLTAAAERYGADFSRVRKARTRPLDDSDDIRFTRAHWRTRRKSCCIGGAVRRVQDVEDKACRDS